MLRAEGFRVNHERVERLWRREGLEVPQRQPPRRRLWPNDGPCIRLRPAHAIHLMQTGAVEANRVRQNAATRLVHVDDLIAHKLAGPEQSALDDADVAFHRREYDRLQVELEDAHRASRLPEVPAARPALDDLLVRLRVGS